MAHPTDHTTSALDALMSSTAESESTCRMIIEVLAGQGYQIVPTTPDTQPAAQVAAALRSLSVVRHDLYIAARAAGVDATVYQQILPHLEDAIEDLAACPGALEAVSETELAALAAMTQVRHAARARRIAIDRFLARYRQNARRPSAPSADDVYAMVIEIEQRRATPSPSTQIVSHTHAHVPKDVFAARHVVVGNFLTRYRSHRPFWQPAPVPGDAELDAMIFEIESTS